jgi:hypothetical protein
LRPNGPTSHQSFPQVLALFGLRATFLLACYGPRAALRAGAEEILNRKSFSRKGFGCDFEKMGRPRNTTSVNLL